MNKIINEKSLYKPISIWLYDFLKNKFSKSKIYVYDTHAIYLSDFLETSFFKKYFPEYSTYKIKIDLIGIINNDKECFLIFVEVKNSLLNLKDLSQLIGYSKIVKPMGAFLISPSGLSKPLNQLLIHFKRLDILEYSQNYFIRIGKWDSIRNSILNAHFIPVYNHLQKNI